MSKIKLKPERDCDSIEERLLCCGWNQALAAIARPNTDGASSNPLIVAHIEPEDGGDPLILLASELGTLIDLVGNEEETYTVRIVHMPRTEFEAMGEWNGF